MQSLGAINIDPDVFVMLSDWLLDGTAAQQIYLVVFAIVRLAGLHEVIANKSSVRERSAMDTLYDLLNDHLIGRAEEGTDAYIFAKRIAALADYSR